MMGGKDKIPEDVLNDLCSRFLINLPQEEKDDMVQVCFHIEMAHWFYLDFYQEEEPDKLPYLDMRKFAVRIFKYLPHLKVKLGELDDILARWREYKARVPVYGAVLLNEDLTKCLLVQSYYSKTSWGFPRGKVNKEEPPLECAIREVLEETGYDFRPLALANDYIDTSQDDRSVRLYIVPGVPYDTAFKPKTRKEIRECRWFDVAHLPASKSDQAPMNSIGMSPKNFFMVWPVVKKLRKWIKEELARGRPKSSLTAASGTQQPAVASASATPVASAAAQRHSLLTADSQLLEQALLAEVAAADEKNASKPRLLPVVSTGVASKPTHLHQVAPMPSSTRQPVAGHVLPSHPPQGLFSSPQPVLSHLPTQQFRHAVNKFPTIYPISALPVGPVMSPVVHGVARHPYNPAHPLGPGHFLPFPYLANASQAAVAAGVPVFTRPPQMVGGMPFAHGQPARPPAPGGLQPVIHLSTALQNFTFDRAALAAAMDEGLRSLS